MRNLTILVVLLLLSGCAGNWSRSDTYREIVVDGVLAVDAYQTAQYQHHTTQYESGWAGGVCGKLPSNSCSVEYFGSIMVSHYVVARLLPPSWRPYWQGGIIAVEVPVIYSNTKLKE